MTTEQGAPAGPVSLPPRGTIAAYTYESPYPTPRERTQLVLVTGHTEPAEDGSQRVLAIPLAHTDEQASFTADQLTPVP